MRVELGCCENGKWCDYLLNQPHDVLESTCLGLRVTLAQIYEGVKLPPHRVAESYTLYFDEEFADAWL